jgi:predicted ribosome quality control (RQC) complex YloA/Tae2 family protein
MISNYYTLSLIARDLNHRLEGATVEAIFSQNKNELVVAASGSHFLLLSCDPSSNHVYLRSSFPRAKKNTVNLFPRLLGGVIRSVSLHSSDRELTIGTDKPDQLLVRMYGSKANVLLVDSGRTVLDSFLRSKEVIASKAEEVSPSRPFPNDAGAFQAQLSSIGHLSAFAALKTMAPLMGSLLIRELFVRSDLDEHAAAAEITAAQGRNLFDRARQLFRELIDSPLPRIYKEGEHPVRFSIVELQQLRGLETERFESVHQAIRIFLSSSHRDRSFHAERDRVLAKMKSEKDRIERTTAKISSEEQASSTRAVRSELSGKLLMAHLHLLKKGDAIVSLENVFSPEREHVEIALDSNLSPAKNAERFFARARKARQSLDDQSKHKGEYRDRYDEVLELLRMLEQVQTPDQWKEFSTAHGREAGVRAPGVKEKEPVPFRVFTVDGGFEVWAGKSSENNDLLTTRHARPNDLWFHARGAGGSHVVLRVGTGKGEISRKAKEQAASVAAYYSKMKNSRLVPVAMTEKKYVHKRKGTPAGTVMVEKETVLLVLPQLPVGKGDG